jgi:very-short-patch-repair endonuclease
MFGAMKRIDPHQTAFARKLRREATPQERAVWNLLSRYRPPFTRQLSVGPYTADLACRRARLIVELDGGQHADSATDLDRTAYLQANGWTVIRFWNSEVDESADGVAGAILLKTAEMLGGELPEPIPSREGRIRSPRSRGRRSV